MADEQQKIGAGHLQAMARAGLKELSQALPAFPDSIRPVEEPGLAGNLTPQEVVQGKGVEQAHSEQLQGHTGRDVLQGFTGRVEQERGQEKGLER